jgi:hypothetical protein
VDHLGLVPLNKAALQKLTRLSVGKVNHSPLLQGAELVVQQRSR